MSYEGYTQSLCEKGHLSCFDCWDDQEKCRCGEKIVWRNNVDQTNGDGEEFVIDMSKYVKTPRKTETCQCCGAVKVLEEETYSIPVDKCKHIYSKSMDQEYPRRCLKCKTPEPISNLFDTDSTQYIGI